MPTNEPPTPWWLFFFLPVVLGVSCLFIYKTFAGQPTAPIAEKLKPEYYTVETARGAELKQKSMVGNCFLCHAYWVPIPTTTKTSNPRFAHANITLYHGKNDQCYNCHMISDRNKYVANDGSGIMPQLPELLCSRCHGLIYNDWLVGTHGKRTGKWLVTNSNDWQNYTCTECHDPHNPKFKYNIIAPPPTWPKKYIRTKLDTEHSGPTSNFLVDEEPKEIF